MSELEVYVQETLLLAAQAVRMAVKNHLIVETLRDGRNYDENELEDFARREYAQLAEQYLVDANRAERQLVVDHRAEGRRFPGGKKVTVGRARELKPAALREVAKEMVSSAVESPVLHHLIVQARRDAWDEVGDAATRRYKASRFTCDAKYDQERDKRIRKLVSDLHKLRRQQADS